MAKKQKVSIIFPVYNEEKNIRKAIKDFFQTGVVDEIIAVDNNSSDKSKNEIKKTKAKYVLETTQGYGAALQRGLMEADGDIIIACEPDGTFSANDIFKFLSYADDFDVVLGTRTSKESIWKEANMGWFLRLGNEAVAKLMEYLFGGSSLTDVGCTYKLIKRKALMKIINKFTVSGSHFSPEFMILSLLSGARVVEIPINYKGRIGQSKITGSNIKAIKLGLIMISLIIYYRIKSWLKLLSS